MNRSIVKLATALLVVCGCARAETRVERLKWEDLDSRLLDKKIAFVLPDGTHVEGKVLWVQGDGLRLKVSKTSNRQTQPKGKHLVGREALSVLWVTEYRKAGRLIGTLGALGLAGGIVAAQQIDIYEGPAVIAVPVAISAGVVGAGVGGYYAGKAFDKRVTEIRIEK